MSTGGSMERPANWGLIGHEWAVELLRGQIAGSSLRHAYLITGPQHVGRRTLGLRLAAALSCPESGTPGMPCGTCRVCRQVDAMQYSDLSVTQAEKEGGVLKVEQVREVRQNLVLKPYQGTHRIALFLRFHEAHPSAANALLKTLEEAPPHALLVLTADSVESVLPTIASRCEVLRLRPLPPGDLAAALLVREEDADQTNLVAHLSGGCPGAALQLLSDPTQLEFRKKRLDELHTLSASSRVEKFKYAEKITNRKKEDEERFRLTLSLWLTYWRDVLVCASGSSAPLVNVDRRAEIEVLARRLGMPGARRQVEATETAIRHLDENVNPRLLAEVVLLDLPSSRS